MKRKSPTPKPLDQAKRQLPGSKADWNLVNEIHKDIEGDNVLGNASKPISLRPLKLEAAVAALLKVKPEPKTK
jgi:hypothetical protein